MTNVPPVDRDINRFDMLRLGKYFAKATVQHLPLIAAIFKRSSCHVLCALTDCSDL